MLSHIIVYDERRRYGKPDKMNSKLIGRILIVDLCGDFV